jgi:hypothetical protein
MPQPHNHTLWIEAEAWLASTWTPQDANTDVIVTFDDGRRWGATFLSYANIRTLTAKNRQTGECLAGAYFWSSDMILIDEVSRPHIEDVVRHLIREGEIEVVFKLIPPDDTAEGDESSQV